MEGAENTEDWNRNQTTKNRKGTKIGKSPGSTFMPFVACLFTFLLMRLWPCRASRKVGESYVNRISAALI